MRWFVILALVAALWVLGQQGDAIDLTWGQYRVSVQAGLAILALLIVACGLALAIKAYLSVVRLLSRRREHKLGRQHAVSQEWLMKNLMALSAGDADLAKESAQKFSKLNGDGPLTNLIQVHTAALAGDEATRLRTIRRLLLHDQTKDYAQRLVARQAILDKDWTRARKVVDQALVENTSVKWAFMMKIVFHAREGEWQDAIQTLQNIRGSKHPLLTRIFRRKSQDQFAELEATLLTALGRHDLQHDHVSQAYEALSRAHALAPYFVPATTHLALVMHKLGKRHRAHRLLHQAWRHQPHPDLLQAALSFYKEASVMGSFRRAERLAQQNADHPVSRLCLAHEALAAGLFGVCQNHVEWLIAHAPTRAVFKLQARLLTISGQIEKSQESMEAAMLALDDPSWVCADCGHVHKEWTALCPACDRVGTYQWALRLAPSQPKDALALAAY